MMTGKDGTLDQGMGMTWGGGMGLMVEASSVYGIGHIPRSGQPQRDLKSFRSHSLVKETVKMKKR